MLNFDIKRKINTLRDILVGKIPDPKEQVEQITIAMIYKFMDDMDLEGAEWGERQFFTDEYKKYAWSEIMNSENSGQERAHLYAEGIEKMVNNPNLPQLFREIFKNAYIPYRDPDTLNMFLKEIGEFSYDNSEDLGNAFEYLLSIMGSQGDAGQFRTPRHIIDMIVEIVQPKKNDTILDPACGTAGFLISAYKYILECNKDDNGNSILSADDRKRMIENFAGYDISPNMVRLARVNMYLHKFAKPQISEYDTLTSEEKWDDSFDVILANPPFMTPKGGIQPHTRYQVQAKRAEVLFVDYITEHLNPTGRAGIIVPEGIVFQSANAYKSLRKYLVDGNNLYAVISLPSGVFNPYSGVKTSILLIDKTIAKQRDEILFVKLENDGFDLGAQRREIKGSQVQDVINIVNDCKDGKDVSGSPLVTIASKEKIVAEDYILVGERYKQAIAINSAYPLVRLGDIFQTSSGGTPKSGVAEYYEDGNIPWLKSGEVSDGYIYKTETKITMAGLVNSSAKIFPVDTVVVAMYGATVGQVGILKIESTTNQAVCGILPNENFNPNYLYHILKAKKDYLISQSVGGAQPNISQTILKNLIVPQPPLSVQEQIVLEIERYQKIIDGARQIIDNYKPVIHYNPEWEYVKLGDICRLSYGYTDTAKENGAVRFIRITDIDNSGLLKDTDKKYIDLTEDSRNYLLNKGDLLVARTGATFGKTLLFNSKEVAVFASFLIKLEFSEIIDHNYYWIFSQSSDYWYQANNLVTGGGQPQFNANAIKQILIPIPSAQIQQEIIAKTKEEMAIVEQNKRLVKIFEQKIKDKVSEVWGD